MKQFKQLSLLLLSIFLLSSCAKVFHSTDASTLATNQKLIAIIPPSVSIAAMKKVDAEALKEQQKTESLNFQKEMYSWLLKRKMQERMTQEVQDIETTNAKLRKVGYPETPLTTAELCEVLGVDGTITSNFSLTKPMSEGGAIALGLLFGVWTPTNQVHVSLNINDCKYKKLIWNYDHTFSGSIGSSASSLVNGLMRQASRKMPYMNK